MLARATEIYRLTRKPRDVVWNRFVARPLAALALVPLEHTRVTPNQLTLSTLVVFAAATAVLVLVPGWRGLLLGVAGLEASYVLDCADGQLARLRGTSSPVGAHLDFLMDELKAFLLVAAVGVRLWHWPPHPAPGTLFGPGPFGCPWVERSAGHGALWLVEALCALVAVASAISLTTFLRRPEYAVVTGRPVGQGAGDYGGGFAATPPARPGLVGLVEAAGRFVVHYPSYLPLLAVLDRIDVYLHAYLLVNAAHVGRSLLGITLRLGRPRGASSPEAPRTAPPDPGPSAAAPPGAAPPEVAP